MTSCSSCRVTALGLLPLAILGGLAGCGGVANDIGNDPSRKAGAHQNQPPPSPLAP